MSVRKLVNHNMKCLYAKYKRLNFYAKEMVISVHSRKTECLCITPKTKLH